MRMRTKKWARPELEACGYFTASGDDNKGSWQKCFARSQPIWLELGCGKGGFLAQLAAANPDKNFIAVDISSDMMGVARRKVADTYEKLSRCIDNVYITWHDIEKIDNMLSPNDDVERIYINFCNPWFKPKQYKHRLTHSRQLLKYREFLKDGGEIRFKTDDDILFAHSLRYFSECGFDILFQTTDLHQSGWNDDYKTEHEEMFTAQGLTTKFLVARKAQLSESFDKIGAESE